MRFLVFYAFVLAACSSPETDLKIDSGQRPEKPAGMSRSLGDRVRLEIVARKLYTFGSSAWIQLVLQTDDLPGESRLYLKIKSVKSLLKNKVVATKNWRISRNLSTDQFINVDLGTLAGNAFQAAGHYELSLAFESEILEEIHKAKSVKTLWSGTLEAGPVAFDVVARRPDQLIEAVKDPLPDPAASLSIGLHAGGKRLELWPPTEGAKRLVLAAHSPLASLKVTSREKLSSGLAFSVLADMGQGRPKIEVGSLCAPAEVLSKVNFDAGRLNFKKLFGELKNVSARLELVPAAKVAYLNPLIDKFWDRSLDLGIVEFSLKP
jgi:hypothetical protein